MLAADNVQKLVNKTGLSYLRYYLMLLNQLDLKNFFADIFLRQQYILEKYFFCRSYFI